MRMFNPHFVLVSAVGLLSAASCTLITDVDRQKIKPPETGSGGTAGSTGKGGAGGTGGSTGGSSGEAGAGAGEAGAGGTGGSTGGGAGEAGEAGAAGSSGSGGSSAGTGGGAGEAGSGGAGGVVPVCTKASGSISLETLPRTFFQDGDRFTLGDGVNDAVTFEFDCGAGVVCNPVGSAAGVGAGRTAIVFDGTEDEAGIADLIVTAINGAGLHVSATLATSDDGSAGAGGEGGSAPAPVPGTPIVIELANDLFGDRTNVRIGERVANGNFTVSGMSGGEAVSCAATVTACSDDDACESGSCDTATNLCE